MTADTDTRRAPRRQVAELVPVTDMLAEAVVGRLGNISETGMLMLASAPMHDDALYQLQFAIPGPNGQPVALDVGAHHGTDDPSRPPATTLTYPHRGARCS